MSEEYLREKIVDDICLLHEEEFTKVWKVGEKRAVMEEMVEKRGISDSAERICGVEEGEREENNQEWEERMVLMCAA